MQKMDISAFLLTLLSTANAVESFSPRANCTPGTVCTPDCSGIRICTGTVSVDIDCGIQTNNTRPFCNSMTKSCDTTPDYCAVNGETECLLGEGSYPVLINCHKYYNCDKTLYRVNYDCGNTAVYDPVQETCGVGIQCLDFGPNGLCKGNTPRMITHPLKKSFYVICTGALPILQKCSYDGYVFNSNIPKCEFVCTKAGRFPDMEDPEKAWYFECIANGNQWIQNHKKCQMNTVFDPTTQSCKKK